MFKQTSDFFRGINSLVDHGSDPEVLPLNDFRFLMVYENERLTELSDSLVQTRKTVSIKTHQLYFKVGEVDEKNSIRWLGG